MLNVAHLPVVAHEKVLRLDVAMDHVLGMAVAQSVRNLLHVLRRSPLAAREVQIKQKK